LAFFFEAMPPRLRLKKIASRRRPVQATLESPRHRIGCRARLKLLGELLDDAVR